MEDGRDHEKESIPEMKGSRDHGKQSMLAPSERKGGRDREKKICQLHLK